MKASTGATVTPDRRTHVWFDTPINVLALAPFWYQREGTQIACTPTLNGGTTGIGPSTNNVDQAASGCTYIKSLADTTSNIHESTLGQSLLYSNWQFPVLSGSIITRNLWRSPTELTDISAGSNVASTGSPFYQKAVPQTAPVSGSWSACNLIADQNLLPSFYAVNQSNPDFPIDRIALGQDTFDSGQGFIIRVFFPGTRLDGPDSIFGFIFGGNLTANGYGLYCLALTGDGLATLAEWYDSSGDGSAGAWYTRDQWRFSAPHAVAGHVHSIRIMPHQSMSNSRAYIEFRSDINDSSSSTSSSPLTSLYHTEIGARSHVYTVQLPNASEIPSQITQYPPTGSGPIRVDIRRDIRAEWQVSLLNVNSTTASTPSVPIGTLVDDLFYLPFTGSDSVDESNAGDLTLSWNASNESISGSSINYIKGYIYDATTDIKLDITGSGLDYITCAPTVGQPFYYAYFEFWSDGIKTPYLWGYQVTRNGVLSTNSTVTPVEPLNNLGNDSIIPTSTLLQQPVTEVNITGPEADPSHESANFSLYNIVSGCNGDPLGMLEYRSAIPVRIETEYAPSDNTKRSVIFQGIANRAYSSQKGTSTLNQQYPSSYWRSYDITCSGMWGFIDRITALTRMNFSQDYSTSNLPNGPLAYKVTDIATFLLNYCGVPLTNIDMNNNGTPPGSDVRLTVPTTDDSSIAMINPGQGVLEYVKKIMWDYLGWGLIFDPNASNGGSNGMWRAVVPPTAGTVYSPYGPPLASFIYGPTGNFGLVTSPTANADNSYIPYGFIDQKSFHSYIVPPENTAVDVVAMGGLLAYKKAPTQLSQWVINPNRFNPSSPDYAYGGQFIPLEYVDNTLGQPELQGGQALVNLVCAREYEQTTHAIKIAQFQAPLLLVDPNSGDSNDPYNVQLRPLRYYDTVNIVNMLNYTGTTYWLVRNCNPIYTHDSIQMAVYEAWSFSPDYYLFPNTVGD